MLTQRHIDQRAVTKAKYLKVRARIKKGEKTMTAIKAEGLDASAYYRLARQGGVPINSRNGAGKLAKPPKKKLVVTDLPVTPQMGPGLFMVFGAPEMLASFARGMQ